jgi:hypothetical protein
MQQYNRGSAFWSGLHDMQTDTVHFYRTVFQVHGNVIFQSDAIVTDKES